MNLGFTVGGYAVAAVFLWLFVGAREDLAQAIESCNTDKMTSIAESEKVVREAERGAAMRRINQLTEQSRLANHAREIAEEAAREAEQRPARVRTVIKRIADENACLTTFVADAVANCLRDGTDCDDAGSR